MHIEAAAVSASVWAHSRPRSVLESFWCFYEDFWPRVVNAGEKKAWLIKRRLLVTCCDSGRMNLTTGTNPERDLECPWRARSACHFQITLSQAFLESVLKKKRGHNFHPICSLSLREDWQTVIFWPCSQRRAVRHGREGGREGGGWINGHFHSHQIVTGHSNRRGTNQKSPLERTLLNTWLTRSVHSNSTKTWLILPSWSRPTGLSRVWVGPAAAP